MDTSIKEKVEELSLNSQNKRKYENLLHSCSKDLKKEKTILKFLFDNLNKEKHDVDQLQSLSFTSLYHSIIGNKTEQLNIEQLEYFAAKLKFDSCQSTITNLKYDIKIYEKKLIKLESIEQESLSTLKENLKLSKDQRDYINSIEQHTILQAQKTEIQQAIKAGVLVKKELELAFKSMNSAGSWGIGDMFGGGFIVTAIKHNKINKGKKNIENIKNLVLRFRRELQDINNLDSEGFKIDISSFNTFADYFLDGIVFDWVVQSKIKDSINTIENANKDTEKMVTQLYRKLDRTNKKLEELKPSILGFAKVQ